MVRQMLTGVAIAVALYLAAALAAPMVCSTAHAGWGSGGCAPVGVPVPRLQEVPAPLPRGVNPHTPCSGLCSCGCQDDPDAPCPCCEYEGKPAAKPAADPFADSNKLPPTGVMREKMTEGGERYSLQGKQCSKEEAFQAIAESIPDRSKLPWVVLVGDGPDVDTLYAQINKAMFRVWKAKPGDVTLKDDDGKEAFQPGVTIMAPDGKVLHRGALATTIEAVRKLKNYDPSKDPDLTKQPDPMPLPEPNDSPFTYWPVGAAAVAAILFLRRKS